MSTKNLVKTLNVLIALILLSIPVSGQIGTRFPSEKKVVKDPVTGTELTFLNEYSLRRF